MLPTVLIYHGYCSLIMLYQTLLLSSVETWESKSGPQVKVDVTLASKNNMIADPGRQFDVRWYRF